MTAGGTARTYDVSLDGQRFLMVKQAPSAQAAAPQIVVVQNWPEEVRRVAPRQMRRVSNESLKSDV